MNEDPEKIAQEYYEVKEQIKVLEKRRKELRNSLFNIFDEKNENEISNNELRVYRVNRPRTSWNEPVLKIILIKKGLLDKVLSPDPKKIKELINQGLISNEDLKDAQIIKDSWYTYTEKKSPTFHPLQLKELNKNTSPENLFIPTKKEKLGEQTLIITDLSRMKDDRVCICGLNSEGITIRPVLPYGVRERNLRDINGKLIIKPFSVVKFQLMRPISNAPHTEDVGWNINQSPVFIRNLSFPERKELMEYTSFKSVEEIFQAEIGDNRFIEEGKGLRSIGTLKPLNITEIQYYKRDNGKYNYRLGFIDQNNEFYNFPVTDCAFRQYCDNKFSSGYSFESIEDELMDKLNKTDCFFRVGLTRVFKDVHWIQISGVYSFPYYKTLD